MDCDCPRRASKHELGSVGAITQYRLTGKPFYNPRPKGEVRMRFVNFSRKPNPAVHCGCVIGDTCIDLTRATMSDSVVRFPRTLSCVEDILRVDDGLRILQQQLPREGELNASLHQYSFPLGEARLAAPILNPQKLIGIGFNYRDHAEETKTPLPKEPLFFAMFASAITGPRDPIVKPPVTEMLDYEAELAVVIGKRGRHIPVEKALDHVAGYTIFNDVSARNFQATDSQWLRVKSFDTFAPMGPWLVTQDELGDGGGLMIECRVNGETRQKSNTKHLIFDVPQIVSYISGVMTLQPGDVIATGTPSGVGFARNPQVFLKAGDVVEVEIERIGVLRNPVV
jgi:2-keto-4-pentenoate hydratase/2-oxohepta-3-ene-1,7-dioic acid hydratase in catechol pathway